MGQLEVSRADEQKLSRRWRCRASLSRISKGHSASKEVNLTERKLIAGS